MEQNIPLEVLNNLILSSVEDTVKINKVILADIKKHLHYAHEAIEFLQLESQLQRHEMHQKGRVSLPFNNTNSNAEDDDSKLVNDTTSSVEVVHDQVQLSYSKPIIKPWEEIQFNKNQRGLGYDKDDNNLHIPNHSKPIKFINGGFLDQVTSESHEKVEEKPKCQHCQRTVIWKIIVLISIFVTIVARKITH